MEYRQLGRSGIKVPVLCFGAGTLGTSGEFFEAWAKTSEQEADKVVGICMDAGLNFFDTADVYSQGGSEIALGKALAKYKREDVFARRGSDLDWTDVGVLEAGFNLGPLSDSQDDEVIRVHVIFCHPRYDGGTL